jgi:hypothetical protein
MCRRDRRQITNSQGVGYHHLSERQPVFDTMRSDASIPKRALVFLDVDDVPVGMGGHTGVARLGVLLGSTRTE